MMVVRDTRLGLAGGKCGFFASIYLMVLGGVRGLVFTGRSVCRLFEFRLIRYGGSVA